MKLFSLTDKGPRDQNQDFYLLKEFDDSLCLIVADGVGGNKGGATASMHACEFFFEQIKRGASPSQAIELTHAEIQNLATTSPELTGMATTLSCAILHKNKIYGAHAGDSRIYQLRGNGLRQLTQDHSEVARLLLAGKLTKEDAETYPRKNILYSAIGVSGGLTYQEFETEIAEGDRILLMTDGVYSVIHKKDLRDLSIKYSDFNDYCSAVIQRVIDGRTRDNYTLVGFQF